MSLSSTNHSIHLIARLLDSDTATEPILDFGPQKPVIPTGRSAFPLTQSIPERQGVPSRHSARFLKELAESGRALEVNTVGQRRWMGCVGGEQWVLEAFRQYGGRYVTVGTDAHYARHVGIHVREAYEAMRAAGFDKVTIYRQRKPVQLSI